MKGLTDKEVKDSRLKYGKNEITFKKNNSFWHLLLESLADPIIKILLIALAIKVIFLFKSFDWYETLGIVVAILLASLISTISEYGSNKAFERLQEESKLLKNYVIRNEELVEIYKNDIVVGDIVKLSSGDKIPADGILLEGEVLVDESLITGETKEQKKLINDKLYSECMLYKADSYMRVTNVGDNTYVGKIFLELHEKDEDSPLKNRLRILAGEISKIGYLGAILASFSFLFVKIFVDNNFEWQNILKTVYDLPLMLEYALYCLTLSVSIIIMAVPEGLPMMITLVLSSNMKKMIKNKVLVRKLVGIEASGSMNVLLTDKTGTLTEGKLKVNRIVTYNKEIALAKELNENNVFNNIIKESLILNCESQINNNKIISGNITDQAIRLFLKDFFIDKKILFHQSFDSKNKYSYVKCEDILYIKGASEILLDKCSKYLDIDGSEKKINKSILKDLLKKYTKSGYRVLLNAYSKTNYQDDLVFIGFVVISDTIRSTSKQTIKKLEDAGINVVMITGDSKDTAYNIGKSLEMIKEDSIILTHDDLEKMSDDYILSILKKIKIVARALPEDKKRLVMLYKNSGAIVGMTGDGINDALALKKSDVSFSLGSGSEVAKEASDIVILDDNILSIYNAVLFGRTIFKSIRKFIVYQLTVNACALIISIIGALIGVSTPITIVQMLWINMIMDTFAGLAFSYEPPLEEYMKEPPKDKNEKILNNKMKKQVLINGIGSSLICILFLKLPYVKNLFNFSLSNKGILTGFFALFVFLGIINSFLSRTDKINIFSNILKNKVFIFVNVFIIIVQIFIIYNGGDVFRTYGLTINELLFTLIFSLLILPIDYIQKYVNKCK